MITLREFLRWPPAKRTEIIREIEEWTGDQFALEHLVLWRGSVYCDGVIALQNISKWLADIQVSIRQRIEEEQTRNALPLELNMVSRWGNVYWDNMVTLRDILRLPSEKRAEILHQIDEITGRGYPLDYLYLASDSSVSYDSIAHGEAISELRYDPKPP